MSRATCHTLEIKSRISLCDTVASAILVLPSMFKKIIILTILLLQIPFSAKVSYSQQEFFPFLGEVTTEGVNVRSGQSTSFRKLMQLSQGEEIVVEDKQFSWYKIRLPKQSESYISSQFIREADSSSLEGTVTATRVNVRSGAGTDFPVVGQVTAGDQVKILGETDGWMRILPVSDSTFGWVHENLISFKSKDIASYESKEEQIIEEIVVQPKEIVPVQVLAIGSITVDQKLGECFLKAKDGSVFKLNVPQEYASNLSSYVLEVEGWETPRSDEGESDVSPRVLDVTKIKMVL